MSQPNWPFEHGISGLATRADWAEEDEEEDEEEEDEEEPHDRGTVSETALPGSDVFLLEGSQLRYGTKRAWDNAR
jgi:hypothetical protein